MDKIRTVPVNVYNKGVRFEQLTGAEITEGLRSGAPIFHTRGDLAYLLWTYCASEFLLLSRCLRMSRHGATLVVGTQVGVSPFMTNQDITREMRINSPRFKIFSHGLLQLSWDYGDTQRYVLTRMLNGVHRDRPSRSSGAITAIRRVIGPKREVRLRSVSTDVSEFRGHLHLAPAPLLAAHP